MPRTAKATTANQTPAKAAQQQAASKEAEATANATHKAAEAPKWIVKVDGKPAYCGIGACGLQFANGKAETVDARAAAWYREHAGYTVE